MIARSRSPRISNWTLPLFGATATIIYAIIWWLTAHLPQLPKPALLATAATIDLAVVVPVLYYLLLVRKNGWPAISIVPVLLVSVLAASVLIPEAYHGTLQTLKLIVPIVELAVLGLVFTRGARIVRTYRASSSGDTFDRFRESIRAALGEGIAADILAYEVALIRYAVAGWKEKPSNAAHSFGYLQSSGYGTVLLAILLATVAEMIGGNFLLRMWSDTAAIIHLVLAGYALMWIVGDFQAMRVRLVEVEDTVVRIRLGIRWDATIPLNNVSGVRRQSAPPKQSKGYLDATPLRRPAYLIEMNEPVCVSGPYGLNRMVTRIGIAVDDEERFEKRLVEVLGEPN